MDDHFSYLDALAIRAADIDHMFSQALTGSKEGAIHTSRQLGSVSSMVGAAASEFERANQARAAAIQDIAVQITQLSVTQAERITGIESDLEVRDVANRHLKFTLDRLDADARRRIEDHTLQMRRISLLARSMRDANSWEASSALLRARESVDNSQSVSLDSRGRKAQSERFTKLHIRGLGMTVMTDLIIMMSDAKRFTILGFDGETQGIMEREDYEMTREQHFHPQARRYLVPVSK